MSPIPAGWPVIRPLFNDALTRFQYFADAQPPGWLAGPWQRFRASDDTFNVGNNRADHGLSNGSGGVGIILGRFQQVAGYRA